MANESQPAPTAPKSVSVSRNVLIVLLLVCLAAVGGVVYLVMRPSDEKQETIITMIEPSTPKQAGVNVLQVTDAIANREVKAEEGSRYKVLIVDESKEGASGIARIGGLVTFVPDTRKGDVVVVEITRLKRSTADAIVLERLETGRAIPEAPRPARAPEKPAVASSPMVGKTFRGTVTDVGREGDGIVKVDNKVVFVAGAAMGEHVEFIVREDMGRFAKGEVVSKSDAPFAPAPSAAPQKTPRESKPRPPTVARTDQPVAVGEVHEVVITDADRNNPDKDGVTRIENFVVFVPGTQPGDKVRIRITELRARSATAEVLDRLPPDGP